MARAQTKADLIAAANRQFEKLWETIGTLDEKGQNSAFSFGDNIGKEAHWLRDKNIRDVLIHLYEWHELLLNWVNGNQKGEQQPFLPEPYNWKTYGHMNVEFWKKHQNTAYNDAVEMLKNSHKKVMALIESFSDAELFTKNYFKWTGGSTLGQYCVSVTASHYDWAIKKVKLHVKTLIK